jgi:hypothetical protein
MLEQSRPITDTDIATSLTKLFHALPPRKGNLAELADGYKIALHGCSNQALGVTVLRYMRGEIADMAMSYAPTPPELAKAVREVDAHIRKLRLLDAERAVPRIEYREREGQTGYAAALNEEFQAWHRGARAGPLMLKAWAKHYPNKGPYYDDQPATEGTNDDPGTEPSDEFIEPDLTRAAGLHQG